MSRLIDADALIKQYPQASGLKLVIENAPTAFDTEKVIAELEERKGNVSIDGKIMYQEDYFIDIDEAIDIVKKGGME